MRYCSTGLKVSEHRCGLFEFRMIQKLHVQRHTRAPTLTSSLSAAPRPAPALVLHLVCTRVLMTNTIWPNLRSHHNRHPHPHHLHIIPRTPLTCNTSCIIGWKINVPHKPAYHGRNRDLVMVHRWLSDELSTHLVTSKLSTDLHCQIVKCLTTTFL